MMDIRQAANAVTQYLKSIESLTPTRHARLEEFDYDQRDAVWTLTFSFDDTLGIQRVYRTFKVDDTGTVLSMKIRHPEEPVQS